VPRLTDGGDEPSWITTEIARRRRALNRTPTQRSLRAGAIGIATSIVLVLAPIPLLALFPPPWDDPNWAVAVALVAWLVAAVVFLVFGLVLLIGCALWLRDRNHDGDHDASP
jgi:hypothetical protein